MRESKLLSHQQFNKLYVSYVNLDRHLDQFFRLIPELRSSDCYTQCMMTNEWVDCQSCIGPRSSNERLGRRGRGGVGWGVCR